MIEGCDRYNCLELIREVLFARAVEVDILDEEIAYNAELKYYFGMVNGIEYEIREWIL